MFVHVQAAIDLDLQGVDIALGPSVAAGRVAAGIGRIAGNAEPLGTKGPFDPPGQPRIATRAEPVAQHDVGQVAPSRLD